MWANCGIGGLYAYGVRASVTSHRLGASNENADPYSYSYPSPYPAAVSASIGRGGASGLLDLGRVSSFSTAGAVDRLNVHVLNGTVTLTDFGSVNRLAVGDTLGQTEVAPGYHGRINELALGQEAAAAPPRIQHFPLGMALVVATTPGADQFWNLVDEEMRFVTQGWYQVHHVHFQELAPIFRARGININAPEHLRAMHPLVHGELSQRVRDWIDQEMKAINRNWSYNNAQHRQQFIRRVVNDNAFWERLQGFQAEIERNYSRYWFSATDSRRRIREVFRRMDGARNVARFRLGEGGRMARLLAGLGGALAIFTIIGDGVAFAENVAGHSPEAQAAWAILENRYRAALNRAILLRATPERDRYLMPLKDALINYLRAIRMPDLALNTLSASLEVYFGVRP